MNTIFNENCETGLDKLAEKSVRCCVTSPPYYALRDYGHSDQIGLEETPEKYIERLVSVFQKVKRVLTDDGTLWVNIGDSYAGSGKGAWSNKDAQKESYVPDIDSPQIKIKTPLNCKPKDLIGIPWMLAFALRSDGWYLRQEIIWNKPNAMPESVKDRCTKSHEQIFLLSKNPNYYFDYMAISEDITEQTKNDKRLKRPDYQLIRNDRGYPGSPQHGGGIMKSGYAEKRNKRSVWSINTRAFSDAHFAVFPPDLIAPCIMAGSQPEDIILDPFMGSGTVAEVAIRTGRKYIGFEINPEYYEIQNRRLYHFKNEILFTKHDT